MPLTLLQHVTRFPIIIMSILNWWIRFDYCGSNSHVNNAISNMFLHHKRPENDALAFDWGTLLTQTYLRTYNGPHLEAHSVVSLYTIFLKLHFSTTHINPFLPCIEVGSISIIPCTASTVDIWFM